MIPNSLVCDKEEVQDSTGTAWFVTKVVFCLDTLNQPVELRDVPVLVPFCGVSVELREYEMFYMYVMII
jgi:hypothetical protein